jgi:hypothetical protein
VLDLVGLAVADDHVGLAGENRRHQLRDVVPAVLVVGVGIDDHIGAQLQAGVEPGLEGGGEALVVREAHDVIDAARARDLDRAVGRAVIDHEPLDALDPRNLAREIRERRGEGVLLVVARDLDDELHTGRHVA